MKELRMKKLIVISAGLRVPSSTALLADQLTDAVVDRSGGQVAVMRIDVRDHAHAITDALLTGFPTGELKTALDAVAEADALVVVTPTFQASYSGLFKSFVDLIEADTLRGVPVLLAATGGSERHSLMIDSALRPLFAYLGAVSVPTGVFAATADFGQYAAALAARVDRAADELVKLAGLAGVGGGASVRKPKVDEFTQVTPFAEMLAAVQG